MANIVPTRSAKKFTPVGWAVMLLLVYMVSRTDEGHDFIWYALILILVFLVVTHYQQLDKTLIKTN